MANHTVESILPGMVYTRPAPDAEPFKAAGDPVAPGETLALVEVMKSFLPVEAEVAGTFTGYLVGDGATIDTGDAICAVEI